MSKEKLMKETRGWERRIWLERGRRVKIRVFLRKELTGVDVWIIHGGYRKSLDPITLKSDTGILQYAITRKKNGKKHRINGAN